MVLGLRARYARKPLKLRIVSFQKQLNGKNEPAITVPAALCPISSRWQAPPASR